VKQFNSALGVLMQHYTLYNQVVPPQCQSQAWIKEEGDHKSLCCYINCRKTAQYLPMKQEHLRLVHDWGFAPGTKN